MFLDTNSFIYKYTPVFNHFNNSEAQALPIPAFPSDLDLVPGMGEDDDESLRTQTLEPRTPSLDATPSKTEGISSANKNLLSSTRKVRTTSSIPLDDGNESEYSITSHRHWNNNDSGDDFENLRVTPKMTRSRNSLSQGEIMSYQLPPEIPGTFKSFAQMEKDRRSALSKRSLRSKSTLTKPEAQQSPQVEKESGSKMGTTLSSVEEKNISIKHDDRGEDTKSGRLKKKRKVEGTPAASKASSTPNNAAVKKATPIPPPKLLAERLRESASKTRSSKSIPSQEKQPKDRSSSSRDETPVPRPVPAALESTKPTAALPKEPRRLLSLKGKTSSPSQALVAATVSPKMIQDEDSTVRGLNGRLVTRKKSLTDSHEEAAKYPAQEQIVEEDQDDAHKEVEGTTEDESHRESQDQRGHDIQEEARDKPHTDVQDRTKDETQDGAQEQNDKQTPNRPISTHSASSDDSWSKDILALPAIQAIIALASQESKVKSKRAPTKSQFFPTTPKKPKTSAETAPNPGTPRSASKRTPGGAVSCIPFPPLSEAFFGLIQEKLAHDPFRLLIAVTFLIRTHGKHAIPVFYKLMEEYPTPEALLAANKEEGILPIIRHLGLQNQRATTYQAYAKIWLENPPVKDKRYPVRGYPNPESGRDVPKSEILTDSDERDAWEIGHLTQGPYAIDSWRIFCRDELRGLADSWNGEGAKEKGFQPEWMRVVPEDKELRAYLRWMWLKEGFEWDPFTGEKEVAGEELLKAAMEGRIAWDEEGGMRIVDDKPGGKYRDDK